MSENCHDNIRSLLADMSLYYERRVPHHDKYMSYHDNASHESHLKAVIEDVTPLLTGRHVLEIACGTGNWTQVLTRRARRVTAVDRFQSALDLARAKGYEGCEVEFVSADAYDLSTVTGSFDAAFAADWWSHMPKSMVPLFLNTLQSRLRPGAPVAILDMLPSVAMGKMFSHFDCEGNYIQRRQLPDHDREYLIVKNFPTEAELRSFLAGRAGDIAYTEYADLQRWLLTYRIAA